MNILLVPDIFGFYKFSLLEIILFKMCIQSVHIKKIMYKFFPKRIIILDIYIYIIN
jgi:hypothetical protein